MAVSCPVALVRVDEHQVRVHALLVTLTAFGYVWSGSVWLLLFLAYDFIVRVSVTPKGSPMFLLSKGITALLPLAVKPVDAGPKRFAAKIGLLFVVLGVAGVATGGPEYGRWLMAVMGFFAAMEAFCGFCVGCRLYSLLLPLMSKTQRRR